MESIIEFGLIEMEIGYGAANTDYFGTPFAIVLFFDTLRTVVGVGNAGPRADQTAALVRAVVAVVADSHELALAHKRVAKDAHSFVFLAQSTDRDSGLFVAKEQIRVVLRHDNGNKNQFTISSCQLRFGSLLCLCSLVNC